MELRKEDHSACLQEGRTAVLKWSAQRAEEALAATITGAPVQGAHCMRRATNNGSWLTVQPSMVNKTELGAQEWRDKLFLRYRLEPKDLPNYCDCCNAKLTICHALNFKKGELVTELHYII